MGQEDHLEEEMATHSSILAWRITWQEEPSGSQTVESQRIRHDWKTFMCDACICISEVVDISPGNLDSSLCFIQSGISHDVCRLSLVLSPESHSLEGSGVVFQGRICRTFWRWYSGRSHYSLMVTKIRHCDRHTGRGKPTHSSILCSDLPKCSCFLANRRSRPSKRSMASDPQRT